MPRHGKRERVPYRYSALRVSPSPFPSPVSGFGFIPLSATIEFHPGRIDLLTRSHRRDNLFADEQR